MIEGLRAILADPDFEPGVAWRRRRFEANELIMAEGDDDRRVFLIREGVLRVTVRVELADHRYVKPGLADLGPGDMFGELALFANRQRTASVSAVTEGELVEMDGLRLAEYLDRRPAVGYAFLKSMASILAERLAQGDQRFCHLLAWGLKVHDIEKFL